MMIVRSSTTATAIATRARTKRTTTSVRCCCFHTTSSLGGSWSTSTAGQCWGRTTTTSSSTSSSSWTRTSTTRQQFQQQQYSSRGGRRQQHQQQKRSFWSSGASSSSSCGTGSSGGGGGSGSGSGSGGGSNRSYHYTRDVGLQWTSVISDDGNNKNRQKKNKKNNNKKKKEQPGCDDDDDDSRSLVPGPKGIPSRSTQIERLQNPDNVYDVLVIGGGITGAGIAMDVATRQKPSTTTRTTGTGMDDDDGSKSTTSTSTTNYTVACIERGDFASETSSRSTKLIWAGLKYMGTATAALLKPTLFTKPIQTITDFYGEMKMVYHCHKERKYMCTTNKHLCDWLPILVPFTEWYISPPPMKHWLYSYFPILSPVVFKFYDALSWFTCPSSYFMSPNQARNVFPQLMLDSEEEQIINDDGTRTMKKKKKLRYCAVFYEAKHNDSRTNLAVAMTAAEKGAHISNYVEAIDLIRDNSNDPNIVTGAKVIDRMTGKTWIIHAKNVIFAGGPFTDSLRQMENNTTADSSDEEQRPAVRGAWGTHIVLPGYFLPKDMGILDYNTSDGRFMFIIPWLDHVLVGTTDVKGTAETLHNPPEKEIQWLVNECQRYLRTDLPINRSDVLSAWRGWRPLAADPHAPPDAPVSRDHVISYNPLTGIYFIAGGKWTTWRQMSEEIVDRVLLQQQQQITTATNDLLLFLQQKQQQTTNSSSSKDKMAALAALLPSPPPPLPECKTLDITLHGGDGYSDYLPIQLMRQYNIDEHVAKHLASTYGGRSHEVCQRIEIMENNNNSKNGKLLVDGYPYIEAEILYACNEYACTIEDILSRRTRIAYLNRDAALSIIPRVATIMQNELGWSHDIKKKQINNAINYIMSYGGPKPV